MGKKIVIAGIGPGGRDYVLPAAEKAIGESDVLIGGKRNLALFSNPGRETFAIGNNLEEVSAFISENYASKAITVLATGDPGVFSIAEFLRGRLQDVEIEVIPGISSFQYLCAKLGLSWNDMRIASLHGREEDSLENIIRGNKKVAVFTGGTSSPEGVCIDVLKAGLEGVTVSVGENLSYPEERIVTGNPEQISKMNFDSLSIMIFQNSNCNRQAKAWSHTTPGIPDNMFIRGDVPMTKEEVRAVTLSKLRLDEDSVVYDIGAGTGSVSIECAIRCPRGVVYAIERELDALDLIKENTGKFGVSNVHIVGGEAPGALKGLPVPDRVFIGGSGGSMSELLVLIKGFRSPVRVVANAVTIETAYEIINGMKEAGYEEPDIVVMNISRGRAAGGKHLMQAQNPVYIISSECGG